MNHELSFLFHEDVQRIFNNFTALFQIRIGFYSPAGEELKVGQDRRICSYCRMVRLCKGGSDACQEEDRKARLKALERGGLMVYECHGGMTEAVKPLLSGDKLLGFAMIGQVRMEEEPPVKWKKLWAKRKQNPSLTEAYREQPLRHKADLPRILELFSDLMDLLTSRNMIEREDGGRLDRVISWLKNNASRKISLDEAASEALLSPSRFSHILREDYNASFTEILRTIRMDQARFQLIHYPEKTVKEIAAALGFNDPLYFSRQFKKETGLSPKEYQKKHS